MYLHQHNQSQPNVVQYYLLPQQQHKHCFDLLNDEKLNINKVFDESKVAIVLDHFTPNKDIKSAEQCKVARNFANCKNIKNYFDDNEYIINDDISIQELYELLQNATLCDIIKLPPRLVLTIKGTNYHQTFFICDDYIKDDKRKIYRCRKNIEKELKKIIKDNRSYNGWKRSEWQAIVR